MSTGAKSLHALVEYWLGQPSTTQARVVRMDRRGTRRCVYVELTAAGELVRMYFFRHPDRMWRLFPPSHQRPAMRI